jgi:hypothetical protein
MNKLEIRTYKSHFGTRWTEFKHNRKNKDKILLLENKFVFSNLIAGPVLAIDCLGETYQGIIDVDTKQHREHYKNLLLINNIEFKYKTLTELADILYGYSKIADRLIVNFSSVFVIYNRLNQTPQTLLGSLEELLISKKLVMRYKFFTIQSKNFGFGNVFLALDQLHD